MKFKVEVEVWSWSLNLNFEVEFEVFSGSLNLKLKLRWKLKLTLKVWSLKLKFQVVSWNLKLRFVVEVWRLKFMVEVWRLKYEDWSLKAKVWLSKFVVQVWIWKLKLILEVECWSLKLKCKVGLVLGLGPRSFVGVYSLCRLLNFCHSPTTMPTPNNKITITVVGLRLSNCWEYPPHHQPHINSKLHDRAEIEQNSENKSYLSIWGDPKTVEPYPNPKISPLGLQNVKNDPKMKSKIKSQNWRNSRK